MSAEIVFDASDFERLAKDLARVPYELKYHAVGRAMHRVAQMGATQVIKRAAERVDIPQKFVRSRTSAFQSQGEATIRVRSDWISLYQLGARQTKKGVTVRGRGSYRSAFIAGMASGHAGVFKRTGTARLPIRELFGPNPANDISTSPDVYQDLINGVAERYVLPRLMHELVRLLP